MSDLEKPDWFFDGRKYRYGGSRGRLKKIKLEAKVREDPRYSRHDFRKRMAIIEAMGGECANCAEDDPDDLEFDHIDWRTKEHPKETFNPYRPWDELVDEIEGKYQLLCSTCHNHKSALDVRAMKAAGVYGKHDERYAQR